MEELKEQIAELNVNLSLAKKNTAKFKKAYKILLECWHELCDESQIHLNKKLRKLDL